MIDELIDVNELATINIMCVVGDCPSERPAVRCIVNPCDHKTCPNLPPTECVLDVCGECKARYYWNNVDVTEFCSKNNTITCHSIRYILMQLINLNLCLMNDLHLILSFSDLSS